MGLPRSLKLQLELAVHAPIFVRLPLFRLCSPAEILQLVQRLTPALAMPGEAIVKEGEDNLGLFFLMRGAVAVERRGRAISRCRQRTCVRSFPPHTHLHPTLDLGVTHLTLTLTVTVTVIVTVTITLSCILPCVYA